MSVQALSWVLDHSPTKGTDRLVLLSLANHAGKTPVGGAWESWPGVSTIQREANLDRPRTVQDALARLEKAGAIERRINGAPDERIRKDRRPNLYRVLVSHGVTADDTPKPEERGDAARTPVDGERGDARRRDGVTRGDGTGCRDASPEPSVNRQGTFRRRPASAVVPAEKSTHPVLVAERLRQGGSA